MALLAKQQVRIAGTEVTYQAAAGGGDKVPTGDVALHVKNGDAFEHTVTVVTPNTVQGQSIGDVAVAVPAGEDRFIGPFPGKLIRRSDGLVAVTYDAVTAVTVACVVV